MPYRKILCRYDHLDRSLNRQVIHKFQQTKNRSLLEKRQLRALALGDLLAHRAAVIQHPAGALLLGEPLTLADLGGFALIAAGVVSATGIAPRWRGAAPIQWAILAGDRETGVSTQKMVLKLDAGDVLDVEKTEVRSDETASSLHDRLALLGAKVLRRTIEGVREGSLHPVSQDESRVTVATVPSGEGATCP